jgi:hypothetical protein
MMMTVVVVWFTDWCTDWLTKRATTHAGYTSNLIGLVSHIGWSLMVKVKAVVVMTMRMVVSMVVGVRLIVSRSRIMRTTRESGNGTLRPGGGGIANLRIGVAACQASISLGVIEFATQTSIRWVRLTMLVDQRSASTSMSMRGRLISSKVPSGSRVTDLALDEGLSNLFSFPLGDLGGVLGNRTDYSGQAVSIRR